MIDRRNVLAMAIAAPALIPGRARANGRSALQTWTEQAVKTFALPGAITAVRLPSGEVLSAAAGYADVENQLPMHTEHRMLGASMGKTFVSALCMQLQRKGMFSLGDKISNWLGGESWFGRMPNGADITVRSLLNHSSGLRDFIDEPGYGASRSEARSSDWVLPTEQKIALILDHPPLFPVGEGYKYSDTNYILLGVIIERVLGEEFYSAVDRYFIKPQKLTRTSPSNSRRLDHLAIGYMVPGSRFERFGLPPRLVEDGLLVYNPATEWTGGGFISNPMDLVRWVQSLFDGSSIDRDDVNEMMRPARALEEKNLQYRGAGFKVINAPEGKIVGHWGSMPGYSGFMGYLPHNGASIAMQSNITTFDLLAADISLAKVASDMIDRPT